MDNLISLIIDLLSALFGESKKPDTPPQRDRPDPSRPRPQARPTAWEDELRRLLENQSSPTVAPPPPRPPATLIPQTPRVITVMTPPPVTASAPAIPVRQARPIIAPPPLPPGIELQNRDLASLSESKQAYARASQIDKSAAERIERTPGQPVQTTTVTRRAVSPEVTQVLSLFKNARTTRQAVIAQVLLGPPRAFEEETTAFI